MPISATNTNAPDLPGRSSLVALRRAPAFHGPRHPVQCGILGGGAGAIRAGDHVVQELDSTDAHGTLAAVRSVQKVHHQDAPIGMLQENAARVEPPVRAHARI